MKLKGINAVNHAREFLIKMGFTVSLSQKESANGHDLIAIKDGRGFTFEVKPAIYSQRSFKVRPVSKKTSDGIIIVFPSGYCFVDGMQLHLAACSKSGYRFMTFTGLVAGGN